MRPALTYAQHARAMLILGLPLVGGHLAQFAISLTDTIMLGWYAVEALAAQSLAGAYFFVLFIVGSGFAWAVVPVVAAAQAQGDETQVRRVTRMGLWLSMLYATACLPLFWMSGPVLRAMGQSAEIAELGQAYLRPMGFALFAHLIVMVMKSYLSALERTQIVMWLAIGGAVLNAVINWVLIFGRFGFPEMGIVGAAWASLVTSVVTAIAVAIYAVRVLPEHALFQRLWRPDPEAFVRVFRLGLPIGATNLAEVGLFAGAAVMVGWLGTFPLAAHGIAITIASGTFMVHLGFSNAATIRAGAAFGRKDRVDLARGAAVAIGLSAAFALITIVVFITAPVPLLSLFLDPAEPERDAILAIGIGLMIIAGLFQLADGLQVVVLGLLRGIQDTQVPMVLAGVSYWVVGAPLCYVFGFVLGWGAVGIWVGFVTGLSAAAILLSLRFRRLLRGLAITDGAGLPASNP